jgi:hypothetical protein
MKLDKIYVILTTIVFLSFAIVFDTFPRPRYSELEKRDLALFPNFATDSLWSGDFAEAVSAWFSDSQPYRDRFMTFSLMLEDWAKLKTGEDNVTFHASTETLADFSIEESTSSDEGNEDERNPKQYVNELTANEKAKVSNAGIVIIGGEGKVRALMCFGGTDKSGTPYANVCNKYKRTFPDINIYCMIVPSAAAYYMPEKVKRMSKDQSVTLRNIYSHLDSLVYVVDVYSELAKHAEENIYLRTDHHWSPLGAYYAAKKFAEVAGVPFHDIKEKEYYRTDTIQRFVGSMYGYSKDISVKKSPEDFIYYTPLKAKYETTFVNYDVDENYQVVGVGRPHKEEFFKKFRNGSSMAYSTFMGGDTKLTQVRTDVTNGRRLIILKDSYGNALPGYLFYSFEEIHVIDGRYFTHNMKEYVKKNKITDILFANNIFQACGGRYRAYDFFLNMPEGCTNNPSTAFFKERAEELSMSESDSLVASHKDNPVNVGSNTTSVSDADSMSRFTQTIASSVLDNDALDKQDSLIAQ